MDWKKKTIPAVLLLSLAVPPAQAQRAARGVVEAGRTTQADGSRRTPAACSNAVRGRRRTDSESEIGISPANLSKACEYLSCRAEGTKPDAEAVGAWETFYRWCDAHIRNFAGALGLRGASIDDCSQDVWGDLMTRLPDIQFDASRGRFTSWLYTIVRSKATDAMRRQIRRPAVSLSDETSAALRGREEDPATLFERHGDRELVRAGLARLRRQISDLSYRVLHLRYFDDLDASQVANRLGISPQQVWAREHRAKRKLGEILRSTGRRLRIAGAFA